MGRRFDNQNTWDARELPGLKGDSPNGNLPPPGGDRPAA